MKYSRLIGSHSLSHPRTSPAPLVFLHACNTHTLACNHMLSPIAICMTHAINHALFQARMRFAAEQRWDMRKWSKEAKITIQCKLFKGWKCRVSDQVRKVHKEHLVNSVMCVFKYLQATWVKSTQEATEYSTQWEEQSPDAPHSVRPNAAEKTKTNKKNNTF